MKLLLDAEIITKPLYDYNHYKKVDAKEHISTLELSYKLESQIKMVSRWFNTILFFFSFFVANDKKYFKKKKNDKYAV